MKSTRSTWKRAAPPGALATSGGSAQAPDAVVATWRQIDAALSPVIGQRGVAALYVRSLHTTSAVHPWLQQALGDTGHAIDLTPLEKVLAERPDASSAGTEALLQNFHDLLASLIGLTLTERLLQPIRTGSAGMPPAQDNKP